ncbi:MAG TPA: alpha/beta hydrolase [Bryobacteraceae bacterium]|jgi:pimeloyl-ACP methyl ester carboxylesterase
MRSAALLALLLATSSSAQNPSYPPTGKLIDIGGRRVHLNCTGTGQPTVVILGAGFSFDWILVQNPVAKFTQVCTYDPSGSAWSHPGPPPTCDGRIDEIHALLGKAGIDGNLVLVGHSIGAVFARWYELRHPDQVKGMVLVDHA